MRDAVRHRDAGQIGAVFKRVVPDNHDAVWNHGVRVFAGITVQNDFLNAAPVACADMIIFPARRRIGSRAAHTPNRVPDNVRVLTQRTNISVLRVIRFQFPAAIGTARSYFCHNARSLP